MDSSLSFVMKKAGGGGCTPKKHEQITLMHDCTFNVHIRRFIYMIALKDFLKMQHFMYV